MVALIEFAGGILFAAGIGSRLVSLVLFVNMTVAFLSVPDDRTNFSHILSKPEDFYGASPYTYWFAALLIMILGPGLFAVDTHHRAAQCPEDPTCKRKRYHHSNLLKPFRRAF